MKAMQVLRQQSIGANPLPLREMQKMGPGAAEIPARSEVEIFPMEEANRAIELLKREE
jgi:hypothetical protein